MAVEFQSGPDMTALTRLVTYDWPALTDAGGCSLTSPEGTTQETAGNVPLCAAPKKFDTDWMFCNWPSFFTVSKYGSGFQMPGVRASCLTGAHESAASLSQSGSVPFDT